MHERNLTNFTVPWHWHEEPKFDYAYKGAILIGTENKTYTIEHIIITYLSWCRVGAWRHIEIIRGNSNIF